MEIWHLGHSSFKIKGKNVTLVTDPFDPDFLGIKFPNVEANVVTISHDHKDHNNSSAVFGHPVVLKGPGEYEVGGAKIKGFKSCHDDKSGKERGDNTIFQITIDGINILHLGDIGQKLENEKIEKIKTPDILFIPIGGTYTIDEKTASEVITQLEPSIIVPMHYKVEKGNEEFFSKLSSLESFLKIMGKENISPQPKMTISKDKIPQETEIIILSQN